TSTPAITAAPKIWSCARRRCAPLAFRLATCKPGRFAVARSRLVAAADRSEQVESLLEQARVHRRRSGNKSSRKCRRKRWTPAKTTGQGDQRQGKRLRPAGISPN